MTRSRRGKPYPLRGRGSTPFVSILIRGTTPCREGVMNEILLGIAGLFEVGWAIGLECTDGFTRLWPTLGTLAAMVVSVALLGIAMRDLPVGTAYAVWTGIGAIGTV